MRAATAVTLVMVGTMFLLAITTPTFDFDEALYRRVAEEMKLSKEYFITTWDGRPFYEKPPTYIWSIVLASDVVDGAAAHASIFASRLPSLLCTLLTVILLAWFWKRAGPRYAESFGGLSTAHRRWLLSPALPVLAYGTGLFAMGGSTSVMLDPMLTLCLVAPLLVFTSALLRTARPNLSRVEMLAAGLGMAAGVAVKGLVAIVLPALALAIHAAFTREFRVVRRFVGPFAIALAGASIFYLVVYRFTGAPFFEEFFIRQHFVRALTPSQGHRGPLIFHVAVVLLLGGPLVAFVLRSISGRNPLAFARWGFPLTWVATVILFYSAMATKLPNYTWPVWPALVLALCVLLVRRYAPGVGPAILPASAAEMGGATLLGFVCLMPVAALCILLGLGADRWISPSAASRAAVMIDAIEPVPLSVRAGLMIAGLILALQLVELRRFGHQLEARSQNLWRPLASAALLNCLALAVVSLLVLPFADHALRGPLVRLSQSASSRHVSGGDLITVGLFSPTVSSSYDAGPVHQIGSFGRSATSSAGQHLLIAPAWQRNTCTQPDFVVLSTDEFLTLCEPRRLTKKGDHDG